MSRRDLPINGLHTFLVTARHLNLTRAAAELCITQSAVSRQIIALEAWFGFPLFHRHARGLTLTPGGERLLPELGSLLEQLYRLTNDVRQAPRQLRLKAPSCAMRWLVPKLVSFEQQYPNIHVALTTTLDHRRRLEDFDAAIIYGQAENEGTKLFDEELTPVMASHLPSADPTLALQQLTFLHPTRDTRDWQLWLNHSSLKASMLRNQHFDTMDLALNAACQGFGIAIADIRLAEPEITQGRLVAPFSLRVRTGASYRLLQPPENDRDENQQRLVDWLSQPDTLNSRQ